ncbi:MAG: dTMP kinase [Chloroflexi bacterium]|nr:MAG: dTMP kinase [Chloroflexota bacterium]
MARGLFITFEGGEGSGKTTQAELLGDWLSSRNPIVVREPGGTELGERIREVVLYAGLEIDAEAEMYLFMASRRQLIAEVIAPALEKGQIVIADRYHDSTLAYQGGARGVPTNWPSTFPRPDITFLLTGPVETGLDRRVL